VERLARLFSRLSAPGMALPLPASCGRCVPEPCRQTAAWGGWRLVAQGLAIINYLTGVKPTQPDDHQSPANRNLASSSSHIGPHNGPPRLHGGAHTLRRRGWRWKKYGGRLWGAPHFFQPTGPPNIVDVRSRRPHRGPLWGLGAQRLRWRRTGENFVIFFDNILDSRSNTVYSYIYQIGYSDQ
jgi:hypothetical protein